MRKNEKGEVEIIIAALIVGLLAWGILVWNHYNQYSKVYQSWVGECYQLGGNIQISGSNPEDCFIDNKPCQVDRYQKYETPNPNPYFNNLPICKDSKHEN